MTDLSSRRVAVIANIIAPYRIPVFRELANRVALRVFFSAETEAIRQWAVRRDLPFDYDMIGGRAVHVHGRPVYFNPRLMHRLWAFDPSAVIVGGFSLPALYAAIYCRMRGASLILVSEGTQHTERELGYASRVMRWGLIRSAKAFIAPSTAAEARFHDLGAAPTRCTVSPYSLDIADRPMRDHSESDEIVRILYVGQFDNRKGVLQLLDAVQRLQEDHMITLTIVGHGPLENALRSAISERQLESTVVMRGFVDQPSLPKLYAEHDLFVFPTMSDGFGVVLLEAMAAGLPVVASRFAAATHDFVEPNSNGWIMDPSTSEGIVAALGDALAARGSWTEIGAAARRTMEEASPRRAAEEIIRAVELADQAYVK